MYSITKRIEISGAHKLNLPYESPCCTLHGHNWIIKVEVSSEKLNNTGMVIDFALIKKVVNQLDHENITDVLEGLNPTAENIAKWLRDELERMLQQARSKGEVHINAWVSKVTVQESEGNVACYTP